MMTAFVKIKDVFYVNKMRRQPNSSQYNYLCRAVPKYFEAVCPGHNYDVTGWQNHKHNGHKCLKAGVPKPFETINPFME